MSRRDDESTVGGVGMRVVVTGATGNVGTAVVRALDADERIDEIVGLARRVPGSTEDLPAKARYVAADVVDDDLSTHVDGADAVIHLAWMIQPSHRPLVTWRANVVGSQRVFEAVAAARVPALVHASSIGAYSPGPADGRPVDESWPTHSLPTASYGREKAYVERLLDVFERDQPACRVVRLRPAFIFQRPAATEQRRLFLGPFVPGSLMGRGRLPVVPLPARLHFQTVHADDVADAYRRAVVGDVRGAFNVAADPPLGADDLAEVLGTRPVEVPPRLVRALAAATWRLHLQPTEPELLDLFLALPTIDTDRARRELGWVQTRTAGAALGELTAGLSTGAGGSTPPLAADRIDRRVREVVQ